METFTNPFKGRIAPAPAPVREPEQPESAPSRKGVLVIAALLVVVLPIVAVGARPAYSALKEWRSERLTATAEAKMKNGHWEAALDTASAAYLLVPNRPATNRLVAQLLTHFNSERALDFWLLSVAADPRRDEDRRALIEAALRYEQLPLAENHASTLLRHAPDERDNVLCAAQVAHVARDYTREYQLLNSARTRWPHDDEVRFRLSRVLAWVGSPAEVAQALAALRVDAARLDQVGLHALEFFLTRPAADFPERRRLAQLLRSHPAAAGPQLVAACALEIDAQPEQRAARLDELLGAMTVRDEVAKLTAADWLLRLGEHERILQMIPWSDVHANPKLVLAHLDALSRLGDRATLERLLATPGLPLREEYAHILRWQALSVPQPDPVHDREALAAIDAAMAFPPSLSFVAGRLEERGRFDLARRAYERLQRSPKFQPMARRGLIRIAQREGDTKAIVDLLTAASAEPEADPATRADLAYHQLLLKRDVRENRQLLQQLVTEYPDRMTLVSALALACLAEEDFSAAITTLESHGFHWRLASQSAKAIYAATLTANGRISETTEVTREIDLQLLLPEERALLSSPRTWLQSRSP